MRSACDSWFSAQPTPEAITTGLAAEVAEDDLQGRPPCETGCGADAGRDGICNECFELEAEQAYWRSAVGFEDRDIRNGIDRNYRALYKPVRVWVKKNYLRLREELPDVANSVLFGNISFDEKKQRMVKTYIKGLRKEAPREYLQLDSEPDVKG